ncbi:2-hydroxyacyl-CoA dehydratase family protein (plasmid) [Aneurinibacillus sp. Ricciae_BoGa-3]|uniref:2-hydroxyacyl-CoA dehydratase family protein n=1 Tax=Aneurinibacillus sp. Ricciae_BoGa-3 TaxID=3022697 RepID=UPI00234087FE|nr:2-hydroxyacyl-CoA dehydratase family protein [Aneurinibacillus sp. Ricciae_BoGa-3]WCK57126.1 2-hydroxyacyl-CoA dehydratase family protein [Aneurinibacillus sp. Ricciae_BoGa-3]
MTRLEEIKQRMEQKKHIRNLCNAPLYTANATFSPFRQDEEDMDYLIAEVERLQKLIQDANDENERLLTVTLDEYGEALLKIIEESNKLDESLSESAVRKQTAKIFTREGVDMDNGSKNQNNLSPIFRIYGDEKMDEQFLDSLSEKELKALQIAFDAIYFDDSSDYLPAIYQIINLLYPKEIEFNSKNFHRLNKRVTEREGKR